MICGEDDNMFTNSLTHLHEQFDLFRLSCSEMFSLSTVNMENICVVDVLHVFTQSCSARRIRGATTTIVRGTLIENLHRIHDCDQCLTTTSGNNHLTDILIKSIESTLLMWAKGDCHVVGVCNDGAV